MSQEFNFDIDEDDVPIHEDLVMDAAEYRPIAYNNLRRVATATAVGVSTTQRNTMHASTSVYYLLRWANEKYPEEMPDTDMDRRHPDNLKDDLWVIRLCDLIDKMKNEAIVASDRANRQLGIALSLEATIHDEFPNWQTFRVTRRAAENMAAKKEARQKKRGRDQDAE